MYELLKKVIFKYTHIVVESNEQNLLDLPVHEEVWLYIIMELAEKYELPILQVIEVIDPEDFNMKKICSKLALVCQQKECIPIM